MCGLTALLLPTGACVSGCGSLDREYVRADRATFDAIAPEYLDYIREDGDLDAEQKHLRRLNVGAWQQRLEAAEHGDD